MRQKHESVKKFHDFESIKSELKNSNSMAKRTPVTRNNRTSMLGPPHYHLRKVKSIEADVNHLEQFSNFYDTNKTLS